MARLMLSLLGPFQAHVDGQAASSLHANNVRSLLAYIAIEADREHERRYLAGLLWPELPDRAALGNMRYALSDLRRALGDAPNAPANPILLVTRESIRLNPDADCWIDVREFERLCDSAAEPAAGDEAYADLEKAVALYRGPLLEGCSLPESAAFEDWLFWTREQTQRRMLDALRRLVAQHVRAGRYDAAQVAARRQVQLEPLDEESHRQLIRALALGGQRGAALRQVEICRQTLAQELGVDLLPQTVALAEAVRAGNLAQLDVLAGLRNSDAARSPGSPPIPSAAPVFVARDRELAQLDRYLDDALDGRGRVVFISGDAGSGKTALMREFVRRALAACPDLVAASGSCNAATGAGDPYMPIREILQMLSGDVEAKRAAGTISVEHAQRLWALLPHTVQALTECGPDLIDLFVPGAELLLRADGAALGMGSGTAWLSRLARLVQRTDESATQPTHTRQSHACEQVCAVLQSIARRHPLLLVLDDLQWVDDASSNLLLHLGRHLAGSRILIAGAYRSPDVDLGRSGDRHPMATVIHELQLVSGESPVDLEEAADRAFVDAILDSEPNGLGEDFRRTFYRHTGGHALFTTELLQELRARGHVVQDVEGRWIEGPNLNWEHIPSRVEAVIAERIDRLPQEAEALLAAASVEGEEFTAEVVARVLGLNRAQVLRELSDRLDREHKLVRGHRVVWLEPDRRSLSYYRFRHALFHDYLYQRLDPVSRARLHHMTGEALEELHGAQGDKIAVQLAHHYEQAGLVARAIRQLELAAEQAARLGAYREAVSDLRRGLTLLSALPESPERAQRELRLRMALAALLAPVFGVGDGARADAVAPADALGRQAGGGLQAVYALFLQAVVHRGQGDIAGAREAEDQMLAQAGGSRQATMLAHFTRGVTELFAGWPAPCRASLEKALSLYRSQEDDALAALVGFHIRAATLAWQSMPLWVLGYSEQAKRSATQAVTLAQELNQPYTSVLVLVTTIWLRMHALADPNVSPQIEALLRLVDESSVEAMRPWARFFGGWLLICEGRVAEGLAQMRHNLPGQGKGGTDLGTSGLRAFLAQLYLEKGYYDDGLLIVGEAQELGRRGISGLIGAELYRLHGALLLGKGEAGSRQAAEALFLQAAKIAREQDALAWELRAAMDLARLWRRTDREKQARARLEDVYARYTEGFDTHDLRSAAALLRELVAEEEAGHPDRSHGSRCDDPAATGSTGAAAPPRKQRHVQSLRGGGATGPAMPRTG